MPSRDRMGLKNLEAQNPELEFMEYMDEFRLDQGVLKRGKGGRGRGGMVVKNLFHF